MKSASREETTLGEEGLAMPETTRTEVTDAVVCPLCGAEPGAACLGVERRDGSRRRRQRCHAERWEAAELREAARREETERKLALLRTFTNRNNVVDSTAVEIESGNE
jgi:hypothetical protein